MQVGFPFGVMKMFATTQRWWLPNTMNVLIPWICVFKMVNFMLSEFYLIKSAHNEG